MGRRDQNGRRVAQQLTTKAERELTIETARATVAAAAVDELPLFDRTSRAFFRRTAWRDGPDIAGSGLDLVWASVRRYLGAGAGWARIRSPHPTPDYRILAIGQPHRLADLGVGDAFAPGLVLMLAAPTLLFSLSFVTQQSLISLGVWQFDDIALNPSFTAVSLLLVVPVGAGVALGIWRVLHATPKDMKIKRVAHIVAALAGGMLIGDVLAASQSNLGPGLLLSGDAGWRWRGLLIVATLLVAVVLAATAAMWPGPPGGLPSAIPIAAYGSLLFCVYLPALLSARYPQSRSEPPQGLLAYAAAQAAQLVSWMPPWVPPGRLALLAVGFPLFGLTTTAARRTRERRQKRLRDRG